MTIDDELVADTTDEVSQHPIDYFSWGHVDIGVGIFLIISLINTIPSWFEQTLVYLIPYWSLLVLSFVIGVIWEIVENTLLVKLQLKFEGRRDSLINAIWDIFFVCVGCVGMWIIKGLIVNLGGTGLIPAYYIVGVIIFITLIICFLIGRSLTHKKS
jgi:hypothetical protein